ncbi:MAG: hypothetical protein P1U54_14885, partial [Immundisolibacteraceae bacterium]|nr:hypothetical protein [Immundisolibacteraceae bacterium]
MSNGDKVVITFDQATDQTTDLTKGQVDSMFTLADGNLGTAYTGAFTVSGSVLTITISDASGAVLVPGATTFQLQAGGAVLDATESATAADGDAKTLSGSLPGPTLTGVAAADSGSSVGLANGDTITVTFSEATNHAGTESKADIDRLFELSNGHSLGSAYSGVWSNGDQTLTITLNDVTGATVDPLVTTFRVRVTGDLRDQAGLSIPSTSGPVAMSGTFTVPPQIVSATAVNGNGAIDVGAGDEIVIVFDQSTNRAGVSAGASLNATALGALLTVGGDLNLGGASATGSWSSTNAADDTLTVSLGSTSPSVPLASTVLLGTSTALRDGSGRSGQSTGTGPVTVTGSVTSAPKLESVVGANAGNNVGLGAGDTLTVTFDQGTNLATILSGATATASALGGVFTVAGGSFGDSGNVFAVAVTDGGKTLVITLQAGELTGVVLVPKTTTFAVASGATLKDDLLSIDASRSETVTLGGVLTSTPSVSSIVAANAGNNIGAGPGDTLTITFDQSTNAGRAADPTDVTEAELSELLTLSGATGSSFGQFYRGVWSSSGSGKVFDVLTITLGPLGGTAAKLLAGTQNGPTQIALEAAGDVRDPTESTGQASAGATTITGTFTSAPDISTVVLEDVGVPGVGIGDTITIRFDQATNGPVGILQNRASVDSLFAVASGSLGSDANGYDGVFSTTSVTADTFTITLRSSTGVSLLPGSTTFSLLATGGLLDLTESTSAQNGAANTLSGSGTGSPILLSAQAANPLGDAITGQGDTITLVFDQSTNFGSSGSPTLSRADVDKLIHLSGGSFGVAYSAAWTQTTFPQDTLVITLGADNTGTSLIPRVTTVTILLSGNLRDIQSTSAPSESGPVVVLGTFTTTPAFVSVTGSNTGGQVGTGSGDTISLIFDQATNRAGGDKDVSFAELAALLTITGGSFGASTSGRWASSSFSDDTLVITLGSTSVMTPGTTTFSVKSSAGLKDRVESSVASSAGPETLGGTLTSAPQILSVTGVQISGIGPSTGDQVVITFDQATDKAGFTGGLSRTDLEAMFTVGSGSFGSGTLSGSFDGAGTALTITIGASITGLDLVPSFTTFSLRDDGGRLLKDSAGSTPAGSGGEVLLGGTLTSPPAIVSVVASNTGNNLGLGARDTLLVTFDQATNFAEAADPADLATSSLDTLFSLSSGSFGSTSRGEWLSPSTLSIVFGLDGTGLSLTPGTTALTVKATANLLDAAASTAASVSGPVLISGTFTS